MPSLDGVEEPISPVHLLLVADTKVGKSTYAAEAVVDGFEMVYIDADNGLSALLNRFNQEPNVAELKKRVNYFAPKKPLDFTRRFLQSTARKPMLWLPNTNSSLPMTKANQMIMAKETPDEPLWIIDSTAIPANTILNIDSWTSLASDGLELLTAEQSSALLSGDADQGLYGEARIGLVYITNLLQRIQCHVIVQAHRTRQEVYRKPKGATGNVKQKDMILEDTFEVPVSSSRSHGSEMGSRFNHIGNLYVTGLGVQEIDFTRHPNRVGGGPPNKKSKSKDLRFIHLTGGLGVDNSERDWYIETTLGQYIEAVNQGAK